MVGGGESTSGVQGNQFDRGRGRRNGPHTKRAMTVKKAAIVYQNVYRGQRWAFFRPRVTVGLINALENEIKVCFIKLEYINVLQNLKITLSF